MIQNISDILYKFMAEEKKKLDEYHLKHGPTIGAMYEGLTNNILNKLIPTNLGLEIVEGFVTDDSGELSKQIDCMLVRGEGESIPFTTSYKWHIKNVLAVFEVKKTLNSEELEDSWSKFGSIIENQTKYIHSQRGKDDTFDIRSTSRAFSIMTGQMAPNHDKIEKLPIDLEYLYRTLIIERFTPLRIIIAYNGYRSESALRTGFFKLLEKNIKRKGYGASSLPQLIICNGFSILKINGLPYCIKNDNDWWNILVSTKENPIRLILEVIWTRLQCLYPTKGLWGDDFYAERLNPFLQARIKTDGEQLGWEYNYKKLSIKYLRKSKRTKEWEPLFATREQWICFNILCDKQKIWLKDEEFLAFIKDSNLNYDVFINEMLNTGMTAKDEEFLYLITEECQCGMSRDGRFIVGENNTGNVTRWLLK